MLDACEPAEGFVDRAAGRQRRVGEGGKEALASGATLCGHESAGASGRGGDLRTSNARCRRGDPIDRVQETTMAG